jgi:hypothetical protein
MENIEKVLRRLRCIFRTLRARWRRLTGRSGTNGEGSPVLAQRSAPFWPRAIMPDMVRRAAADRGSDQRIAGGLRFPKVVACSKA